MPVSLIKLFSRKKQKLSVRTILLRCWVIRISVLQRIKGILLYCRPWRQRHSSPEPFVSSSQNTLYHMLETGLCRKVIMYLYKCSWWRCTHWGWTPKFDTFLVNGPATTSSYHLCHTSTVNTGMEICRGTSFEQQLCW